MNSREQIELEHMALVAELSRQLAHDFSNLLYNLLLQIEIWEKTPKSQPVDWTPMKHEGQRMTALLREWQRFHDEAALEEVAKVDLHQLIRHVASNRAIQVTPSISAEPLWFTGCALAVKHLLDFVLQDLLHSGQESNEIDAPVSIQTETTNDKAIVRISATGRAATIQATTDGRPGSLLAATCQSLARRLDVTMCREEASQGQAMMVLEIPL